MNPRAFGLLCGGMTALVTCVASAQARVSVGPFTGQRADEAQRVVASAMAMHSGEIEWVADSAYSAAAARLGLTGLSGEEDIARVGREMRLDAVVVGELQRRGRRDFLLRVRVLRGRDGSTLGTTSWELHSLEELSLLQAEIWDQLHNYLRVDTSSPDTGSSATPSTPNPPPGEAGAVASTPGLALATVSVSGGVGTRSWRMPVLGDLSARGYENNGFAEGGAEASLYYRWAHSRVGFGVSGGLLFPISLASRGQDASGNIVSLPTTMLEGWAGASIAYRPPAGGSFRLDAGIVSHSFGIDTSALPIEQRLAPVSYTGLRVAAEGIAPLYATADWELGALFAAELRVVAIGSEVRSAFGENPNTTIGLAGTAGLQLRLDGVTPGLAIRVGAEFLRYRTAFSGRADIGTGSDSVDDYVRIHFGISYGILTPRAQRPGS